MEVNNERTTGYSFPNEVQTPVKKDEYTFRQKQQKEDHNFQLQQQEKQHQHEIDLVNTQLGFIGKLFGSKENSSKNITAIICLTMLVGVSAISLCVYFFSEDVAFVKSMWQSISPIITLALGYLFGKNN